MSGLADRICSSVRAQASAESTTSSDRVHGHTILHDGQAATIFDEVGLRSVERLSPGFTEDSSGACQSGIGYKRSVDVARPAH